MSTGYSTTRAIEHDANLDLFVGLLTDHGHSVERLDVDGHRPDLLVDGEFYIDIKTAKPRQECCAVEIDSFQAYQRIQVQEGRRVYILHAHPRGWTVDTPETFSARIIGGPRRPTANGSLDDWYLAKHGGTKLLDWLDQNAERAA